MTEGNYLDIDSGNLAPGFFSFQSLVERGTERVGSAPEDSPCWALQSTPLPGSSPPVRASREASPNSSELDLPVLSSRDAFRLGVFYFERAMMNVSLSVVVRSVYPVGLV